LTLSNKYISINEIITININIDWSF